MLVYWKTKLLKQRLCSETYAVRYKSELLKNPMMDSKVVDIVTHGLAAMADRCCSNVRIF